MTTALLAPPPIFRAFDNNGNPLVGGLLYTYAAGTTTPQASYPSSSEATPNTNPIVLNFRGEAALWLDPTLSYKLLLTDSLGNTIPGYPVDNIAGPLGYITAIVNQAFVGQALYPQTIAEVAASVTPTFYYYPPYDIRRYGADPTGTNPSDTAMASAISVATAPGFLGATIRAPAGKYTFASSINLNSQTSIIILGDSGPNAGLVAGTTFTYSGVAARFIDLRSASGCQIRNLQIEHSATGFGGIYIDMTHGTAATDAANNAVLDCYMGANIGAGCNHINLDKVVNASIERCDFQYGSPAIQGQAHAGSSYSNGVRIVGCQFVNSIAIPIQDPGEAWNIQGCVFENLFNGQGGAFSTSNGNTQAIGLIFTGNWCGDVSVTTACNWIAGQLTGALISGNVFFGNATGTTAISLFASTSTTITGNEFSTLLSGITFQSGGGGSHSVSITNNAFVTVTTPITTSVNHDAYLTFNPNSNGTALLAAPNAKQAILSANGMEISPNGVVRMWGKATGLANGSNTISFPATFPTACWNFIGLLSAVNQTTATFTASTPTTTNVVVTLVDSGATVDTMFWQAIGD